MSDRPAVAVIGMACRFPGARSIDQFWSNLRQGVESIRFFSEAELASAGVDAALRRDPAYVPAHGALDDIEWFDAAFFAVPPREAAIMDPQHRIFLECAWTALEAGGYVPETAAGRVGVFAGAGMSTYLLQHLLARPDLLTGIGSLELLMATKQDFVPTRVAYKLNLRGPAVNSNTACSTGLVNIHLACQSLLTFECDMALAGGVSIQVPQDRGYLFEEGGILSTDGHNRAFDARASGTVSANGAGVVLLKRLDEAIADGDHIHAVIRGSAINNDGSDKAGFTAPSVSGQAAVIAEALAVADVPVESIEMVEAHGTATLVGDPIEITALSRAWQTCAQRPLPSASCAIGSVKSNFGHLDEAAGVAGFIKAVLAVERGEIPPTLHAEHPNPALGLATGPFFVNSQVRAWRTERHPRRAAVSSFGLGGTNAHAVLEQAPADREPADASSKGVQLFALSARTMSALDLQAQQLADALEHDTALRLPDVAHTLRTGRRQFLHRRVVLAHTRSDALDRLRGADPTHVSTAAAHADRPVIFMFSGHGAQYAGMGGGLYDAYPVFRSAIDRSTARLASRLNINLRDVLFGADAAPMQSMAVAQPAIFALEHALAELWQSWGVRPAAMIGHSAGEYAAACLAGVWSVEEALDLLATRGALLDTTPAGAMLAVALDAAELEPRLPAGTAVAVVTGPGLSVVAGLPAAVASVQRELTAEGIDCQSVDVAVAAHSALMESIAGPFEAAVAHTARRTPSVPFMSNVSGNWITPAEATSSIYWARHLRAPVRFGPAVAELLAAYPTACFLEIGPGRSLAAPVRRHPQRTPSQPVFTTLRHADQAEDDDTFISMTRAHLWTAGVRVDLAGGTAAAGLRRVPLPTYPFERKRFWIDPPKGDGREAARTAAGRRRTVDEWLYLPTWQRTLAPAAEPTAPPRRLLLIGQGGSLERELAARLSQRRHVVLRVPTAVAAADRLHDVDAVIDLRLTEEPAAGETPGRLFGSILAVAQALAHRLDERSIDFTIVSTGLQDVTGLEPIDAAKSVALGLVHVLEQEFPHIRCRSIDVMGPDDETALSPLVDQLANDLLGADREREIAWRGPHRLRRDFVQVREGDGSCSRKRDPSPSGSLLREQGVYLLTGGIGEVGTVLAEYLARTVHARLVLTSRRRRPPAAWLEQLRTMGAADVWVRTVDAADEAAMRQLVTDVVERFGRLDGVIHAAGVTSPDLVFRGVLETTADQIAALFHPKIAGTLALERALRGHAIDFCLLMSSNASTLGGLGLCAYAGANHFLDTFAALCRRQGLPWTAANWDGWPSEAAGDDLVRTRMADFGMTRPEAEEAFTRALACRADRVVVSAGDLASRIDRWLRSTPPAAVALESAPQPAAADGHGRPEDAGAFVEPATEAERAVAEAFGQLLGVSPIGRTDNFFDLGGDSLLASRVAARLHRQFDIAIPMRSLFANATVSALGAFIDGARSIVTPVDAIPRVPDRDSYAMSHAQRRLWILHQLGPASPAYHVPLHQELNGPLDRTALETAIAALVQRHESLRTTFAAIDGEPRQIVHDSMPCQLEFEDLSRCADPAAMARQRGREHAARPFDLEAGPLLRVALLRWGQQRHVLLLTAHHIVVDGSSIGVIARDLAASYAAARLQSSTSSTSSKVAASKVAASKVAAPLAIHYRDFAAWQNQIIDGDLGRSDREYWHKKLALPIPTLDLVEDFPRPATRQLQGREPIFEIGAPLTGQLRALARHRGGTLFMALLATLKAFLHRVSGAEDIIVGTPAAGRDHADLDDQVGFYLNTLALRDEVRPSMRFDELFDRVRATAMEAYDHQRYPFDRLVQELDVARDASRSPIFDVMMILETRLSEQPVFEGLSGHGIFEHTGSAKLDLSFNFKETSAGGLVLGLEYDADLFADARIRAMAEQFEVLLAAAVADPSATIGRLPLLSPATRRRVVSDFNQTRPAAPVDVSIVGLFERCAAAGPDRPAARHQGRTLTYRNLDARANQIARHLSESIGFGRGQTAALMLPSEPDILSSLLAVLKLGGAALLVDPSSPARHQSFLLEESASTALVVRTPPDHLDFSGVTIALDRDAQAIQRMKTARPDRIEQALDDTALVFFTSGSTGGSKGVQLTHRGIANELDWLRRYFCVTAADVLPQKTTWAFVDSIAELLLPLTLGGCVYLRSDHDVARDLPAMARWFESIRPTIVQFVPGVFREFAAVSDGRGLDRLRALILSGAVVGRDLVTPCRAYNLYGCSECTSLSTFFEMNGRTTLARVPIGKPLQNTRVYVLDGDGQPCPPFVPGELYIGGEMVASGYVGRQAMTAERFVPSPFEAGERLFRTGDIARWLDDGTIDHLGRRDDQIKVRGVRVEYAEVEGALLAHPAVAAAVAAVRPAPDGEAELVGYVVLKRPDVTGAALRRHVAERLPGAMVPSWIVPLDTMPRTAAGKIDRRSLPEPDRRRPDGASLVTPGDDLERAIHAAWTSVLGIDVIGIHDDFFDLGGHSLRATRASHVLQAALGIDVGLVDIFRAPTIARLAERLRARETLADPIVEAAPLDQIAPMTLDEQRLLGDL